MTIGIDAQLSPALAPWIQDCFGVDAVAVRDLGLRDAKDREIYLAARSYDAVILAKDSDFLTLFDEMGSPPRILWVTCGNTSNDSLRVILESTFPVAMTMLEEGEGVVEITG